MHEAVITIFRSRLDDDHADEYAGLAPRIDALARSMPGFVDAKTFGSADGERVTVVTFADRASHEAWREHPEHREAQRLGRDRFYLEYSIQVGAVTYEHRQRRRPERS